MTCPVNISSLHAATGSSTRTPLRVPFLRCHPSPPLSLCCCFAEGGELPRLWPQTCQGRTLLSLSLLSFFPPSLLLLCCLDLLSFYPCSSLFFSCCLCRCPVLFNWLSFFALPVPLVVPAYWQGITARTWRNGWVGGWGPRYLAHKRERGPVRVPRLLSEGRASVSTRWPLDLEPWKDMVTSHSLAGRLVLSLGTRTCQPVLHGRRATAPSTPWWLGGGSHPSKRVLFGMVRRVGWTPECGLTEFGLRFVPPLFMQRGSGTLLW